MKVGSRKAQVEDVLHLRGVRNDIQELILEVLSHIILTAAVNRGFN